MNATNLERAKTYFFETPPQRFPLELVVAGFAGMDEHKGSWKRISPSEIMDALLLRVAERITQGADANELANWKKVITTVSPLAFIVQPWGEGLTTSGCSKCFMMEFYHITKLG